MIRPLIVMTRSNEKDPTKDPRLEVAVDSFVNYLQTYRTDKPRDSKHGKMGPVGKLLSRMRSGKMGEQVLGEAIRIHEMTAKPFGNQKKASTTPEQFSALERGVTILTEVLSDQNISLSDHKRILDAVGAMIYYRLEKASKDVFYAGQERFRTFLEHKYQSLEGLRAAWDDPKVEWNRIPYPSLKFDKNKNDRAYEDIVEYLGQTNELEVSDSIEEDVEDEYAE